MTYKPTTHTPTRRSTRRTLSRHGARLRDSQSLHSRAARRATSAGLIRMITPRRARGSGQSGRSTWAWRRCRAFGVRSSRLSIGWPRGRGRLWGRTAICGLTGGAGWAAPSQKEPDPPKYPRLLWSTRRKDMLNTMLGPRRRSCTRNPERTCPFGRELVSRLLRRCLRLVREQISQVLCVRTADFINLPG